VSERERDDRELVASFLAGRDARCPVCRYNLRDAAGERCPECGAAIELTITAGLTGGAWWLAGVLGSAVSLLTALALLRPLLEPLSGLLHEPAQAQFVAAGYGAPSSLPNYRAIFLVAGLAVLSIALLATLIAARRRVGRLPIVARIVVGFGGAVSPLILLGIIWLYLRS
jgi:hypothetical protein